MAISFRSCKLPVKMGGACIVVDAGAFGCENLSWWCVRFPAGLCSDTGRAPFKETSDSRFECWRMALGALGGSVGDMARESGGRSLDTVFVIAANNLDGECIPANSDTFLGVPEPATVGGKEG